MVPSQCGSGFGSGSLSVNVTKSRIYTRKIFLRNVIKPTYLPYIGTRVFLKSVKK
jgi:hypothetical protein